MLWLEHASLLSRLLKPWSLFAHRFRPRHPFRGASSCEGPDDRTWRNTCQGMRKEQRSTNVLKTVVVKMGAERRWRTFDRGGVLFGRAQLKAFWPKSQHNVMVKSAVWLGSGRLRFKSLPCRGSFWGDFGPISLNLTSLKWLPPQGQNNKKTFICLFVYYFIILLIFIHFRIYMSPFP